MLVLALAACGGGASTGPAAAASDAGTSPGAAPAPGWKSLAPGTSWQWQIDGKTIDETVLDAVRNPKKMYDVDMERTGADTITRLQAKGVQVVCYLETGAWESYRSDAAAYPQSVLGKAVSGFPDERWVDVRQIEVLRPIIGRRLDAAKAKGCDGVEPDLDDSYTQDTGFAITRADQIRFNTAMIDEAHRRGLSMGLKNGSGIAAEMSRIADWALNEQCNRYVECEGYKAFIAEGKAVFNVEYSEPDHTTLDRFCPYDNQANFDGILKLSSQTLGARPRAACRFE